MPDAVHPLFPVLFLICFVTGVLKASISLKNAKSKFSVLLAAERHSFTVAFMNYHDQVLSELKCFCNV